MMVKNKEIDGKPSGQINVDDCEQDGNAKRKFDSVKSDYFKKRSKFISLLSRNVLNYHRAIIKSRRSNRQLFRRRRMALISYCIQQLHETQLSYFLLIPSLIQMYRTHKRCEPPPMTQERSSDVSHSENDETDSDDEKIRRSKRFYEDVACSFNPTEWLNIFRVSRETFHWLCDQLKEALKPIGNTFPLKTVIPLEKRVAMALYTLASGADYREVAARFDISRTSVCKYIKRFAESVLEVLGEHLLALPTSIEEYDEIRHNFQRASNMPPLVVGVLGQCQILVNNYTEDISAHKNMKGISSLVLQAIVDDKLLFRKICMDSHRRDLFFEKDVVKIPQQKINGQHMPCFIIAPNNSYPLRPWLLHSYDVPLNPHEHDFNDAVDQILEFKNKAFTRLFGRWHILHRKCDLESKTMEVIVTACCALHNLLEENEDGYMKVWENNLDMSKHTCNRFKRDLLRDLRGAIVMRDFLARTISSTEV